MEKRGLGGVQGLNGKAFKEAFFAAQKSLGKTAFGISLFAAGKKPWEKIKGKAFKAGKT